MTTDILTTSDVEVLLQAVAEGVLPYMSAGGTVDPALALLRGLNSMYPSAERD